MRIETWDDLDDAARSASLLRPATRDDETVRVTAAEIIRSVRSGGDAAVRAMTRKFDGTELENLKVSENELAAAARDLKPRAVAAIDLAIENVRRFRLRSRSKRCRA